MESLGEEVHRLHAVDAVAPVCEHGLEVARQGRGVAAHVGDAAGAGVQQGLEGLRCKAGAGRVDHGDVRVAQLGELAAHVAADDLGVELKVVDMSFDNLCINLAKGDFDIVIAGMASTEERLKSVDFSDPYFKQQQAILIRAEDDTLYNKPEDLSGHKVGVQNGTIQVPIANELVGEENVVGLVKAQDLIMELKSGKLDVVYIDYTAALAFAAANDDLTVKDIGIESDSEGQCIGVQKGNEDFVACLNEKIAEMQEQGLVDQYVAEAQTLAGIE